MSVGEGADGQLLAISDLHVSHPENRRIVEGLLPSGQSDWLIVCGDVSDALEEVRWALELLRERFARVIWTPGNHELWTLPDDRAALRGERRYRHLVEMCRTIDVLTPEDPFPMWHGAGGPFAVAPLFLLYDYSFGRNIAPTKEQALAIAHRAGVVCSDEFLLHPDPYPTREAWCDARLRYSEARLGDRPADVPIVIASHFPLIDAPTTALLHPEFAQWCGTLRTSDWHRRFKAVAVVYGHLHIPRTTWHDGVRFEEVSLGYPREWHRRGTARPLLRSILPFEGVRC